MTLPEQLLSIAASHPALSRTCLEAAAIIAKLPVTADGVIVQPDQTTWSNSVSTPCPHQWKMRLHSGQTFSEHAELSCEKQYASREAAEKAREG